MIQLGIMNLVTDAVLETIEEFPQGAAEGPMYMAFQEHGMSFSAFTTVVETLIAAGKVRREGNLLFAVKPQ